MLIQDAVRRYLIRGTDQNDGGSDSPYNTLSYNLTMAILSVIQFFVAHILLIILTKNLAPKTIKGQGKFMGPEVRSFPLLLIFAVMYGAMITYLIVFILKLWR